MFPRPPSSTLFPYTPLFRSGHRARDQQRAVSIQQPESETQRGSEDRRAASSPGRCSARPARDRKSTRLNSSHGYISYAVFCLTKKKKKITDQTADIQISLHT